VLDVKSLYNIDEGVNYSQKEVNLMLVYVLNKEGNPLMPCKPSKVRKLLNSGKAKIIKKSPLTIRLLYGSSGYKQEINLGVDAGAKTIGLSATTENQEVYSGELQLRNDIGNLLIDRRQYRRSRRNRKNRYRQARFLNRVSSKNKLLLSPSIENKIQTHLNIISKIHNILPITKIIFEVASFDIEKIKKRCILDEAYKDSLGFWNVREYVLCRDNHKCQGKKDCKNEILNVHHIESRKTGNDSPDNLITLCEECHNSHHKGISILNFEKVQNFRRTTFMGMMRWTCYNRLKALYSNVENTYGYITKNTRITNKLPKEHRFDAMCISQRPLAKPLEYHFYIKQVRNHNRQIHKAKTLKGGLRKLNQAPYKVKGFRLFDKVKFQGKECFIFGRRSSGYFNLL